MDPKLTYTELFNRIKVAGHDWGSDLELGNLIISHLVDVNAPDAQAFYGAGGSPLRKQEFAMLLAWRTLPDWRWRLNYNGTDYTYSACKDLMAGEYCEWSAHSIPVAVLGAVFQHLAEKEQKAG